MDKVTGRLSKLQDRGDVDATDARFESFEKTANMERLSKHQNTKATVNIGTYANRREVFPAKSGCNSEYYKVGTKDCIQR